MNIVMTCLVKPYKGEQFTLTCDGHDCSLVNQQDEQVLSFPLTEMGQYAKFPSFSNSQKYFSLLIEGKWFAFRTNKSDDRELRRTADLAIAKVDPDFASSLCQRGRMRIGFGVAGIVGGLVVTLLSYASAKPGGSYSIWYGIIIIGIIWFFRGLSMLWRGQAIEEVAAEETSPQHDE